MLTFDTLTYLQEKGIDYTEEGKNTTAGWVEVNCPFCGDDPSYHLGISAERLINCWRCGAKGSILKYIAAIENCSWNAAKKISEKYVDETLAHLHLKEEIIIQKDSTVFPEMKELRDIHYDYLKNRGFDPELITHKYKLKTTGKCRGQMKKYSNRIIVPTLLNRVPVNFTAMDYTGSRQRYIHCDNDNAMFPMKDIFYNIDTVRDSVLIVEGVTDVWRMGDSCVAVMGTIYTKKQAHLLIRRKVQRCFIMFDAEPLAQKRADSFANFLSTYISYVEVITLPEGDPGSLSDDDAKALRRDLNI